MSATPDTIANVENAPSVERAPLELWQKLLAEALNSPGKISEAYSAFHNYSISNQIWLMVQHARRGLPLQPCAGYGSWRARNRYVKKGEKGLCVLAPMKAMLPVTQEDGTTKLVEKLVGFRIQRTTFTLAQTEGDAFNPEEIVLGDIDAPKLVKALGLELVPFDEIDGNIQGYALPGKKIAVSPIAKEPARTLIHEVAHQLLGHVDEHLDKDGPQTARSLKEAEAEGVAYIVSAALKLGDPEYSRGYIQTWWQEKGLPEDSAKKIFSATERIFKAINQQAEKAA